MVGSVQHIYNCHNLVGPQTIDKTFWWDYQFKGDYSYYTYLLYPDGKLAVSYKDFYFNDWALQADWQWSANGTSGWTPFTRVGYTGDNGTQYNVPDGGSSRRIIVQGYPKNYNVHSKWIRLCVRALYNYIPRGEYDGWNCTTTPPIWYPY